MKKCPQCNSMRIKTGRLFKVEQRTKNLMILFFEAECLTCKTPLEVKIRVTVKSFELDEVVFGDVKFNNLDFSFNCIYHVRFSG